MNTLYSSYIFLFFLLVPLTIKYNKKNYNKIIMFINCLFYVMTQPGRERRIGSHGPLSSLTEISTGNE